MDILGDLIVFRNTLYDLMDENDIKYKNDVNNENKLCFTTEGGCKQMKLGDKKVPRKSF